MTTEDVKRKLSAILSADVQGYSRLMGDDEQATVETITAYRTIMTDVIQGHHGRVVDAKGDNVLAEFSSVVDAVQAAVEIQKQLKLKNAGLPENRRMAFRIGVNLGDVIEKGDTIYGDGVNIAARLESLAEGGGICISGTAFDHVGKKLPLGYKFLGEQTVKNIEKRIRTYKVLLEPEAAGKVIGEHRRLKTWHWTAIFGLIVLVVVAGSLTFWEFYVRPDVAPASIEKMAYPLPEKPSIAVLPFDNMSKDPEQDYFCDGITEEIITSLSKIHNLFVIARNSTFTYKGKPVQVQQVAEDLGVRFVLEGSVRKSKDRIRITAQLIDAITGKHLWAERYDTPLKDIFVIEDEITKKVITELTVKLTEGEQARVWSKESKSLEVYLKNLEAKYLMAQGSRESYIMLGQVAQELIDMEPESAVGYNYYAWHCWLLAQAGESPRENIGKAFKYAQKSLSLDEYGAGTHALLGSIYLLMRKYEEAIAEGERSVELLPNGAEVHTLLGITLRFAGRPDEAIVQIKQGIRLNPFPPYWCYMNLGGCYVQKGEYEKANEEFKRAHRMAPRDIGPLMGLVVTYILLNRDEEARSEVAKVLEINPHVSVKAYMEVRPFKNEADIKRVVDALHKAGLK